MMRKWAIAAPLLLFSAFLALAIWALVAPPSRDVPSRMIGQPLPAIALDPQVPGKPGMASADYKGGEARLINVFGSWCIPCRVESPQMLELARAGVPIDAVAVRDTPEQVQDFLAQYGDPFAAIGADPNGRFQVMLGSSGVPESFIVDGEGIIRYQHIGEIRPEHVADIVAKWREASQ
ncbi:redoxin family protein [Pseudoblastomonas halimionae]|nr:redoxin family protein [Alteriqipengyuania halimionae]